MGLRNEPGVDLRMKFAKGLIQRLACLEAVGKSGFIHGDVSDANVMLDDSSGKVNLIDFDCFVFESPTLQRPKLSIRDGGSKGTPGYIPEWLSEDGSTDLAPLGDRFARDMMLVELLGFREGDPIDLSPLYWTEQEELMEDIETLANSLQLVHLQDMRVFDSKESERPSSFVLADRLGLLIENNVGKTLSSPPILPYQSIDKGYGSSKTDSVHSAERNQPAPIYEMPSLVDFPRFILTQADRAVIGLGKAAMPLLKAIGIGLAGITLAVIWVLVLVWLLLNVSLPANLILCGGMIYATHFFWKNPDLLKKYLRLN